MYIADSVRTLLRESRFLDALPGYLLPDDASQARIGQLLSKLRSTWGYSLKSQYTLGLPRGTVNS